MLSPTERELIRRDPALPGLGTLLDAAAFREALQASAETPITSARLRYLRYKPAQNCLAAYTLSIGGIEVDCHAKAYPHGETAKLRKAADRPNHAGPLGAGRFAWPREAVEVCVFPNDNKLGSLSLLQDPVRRQDFLRRHLPGHPDVWHSAVRTLAYKPERRWVGALETDGSPHAVCKVYVPSAFNDARVKARHFVSGEVLKVPPLFGRSKRRHALFFGWAQGELLSHVFLQPEFAPGVVRNVGVALWELHQRETPGLPERSCETAARAALELGRFMAFLLPKSGVRIQKLARSLATAIGALPPGHATIHGDFYARQVLLEGGRVTLLDLDEAARGDALIDLGSFAAHLECEVIAGWLSAHRGHDLRDQFLAGYGQNGGGVDEARLHVHAAERLFARAADFFRTHHDGWPQHTEALLARVEAWLTTRGPARPRPAPDPKLPMLERALSLQVVEPRLVQLLTRQGPRFEGARLEAVALRRHKPGRRALIEYRMGLRAGESKRFALLGKVRRRGVDEENLALSRELGAGRFAPESPDGIAIPAVVGAVPELGLVLQWRVPGQPLGELLAGPNGLQAARRAADAISKLHSSDLLPGKAHFIAQELEILDERLRRVTEARPEWSPRLARLRHACHRLAWRLPGVPQRLIHRDFYHDQLLLDGPRVWLLDLDLLCAGDPALDAGNFAGHLLEWAARSPAEAGALHAAAEAFTRRFLHLNRDCTPESVEIYTTLTLARHIDISLQFADRAPFTAGILKLCEARCGLKPQLTKDNPLAACTL